VTYFTVQAGIGDQMHYQGVPRSRCKKRQRYFERRDAKTVFERIQAGEPVRNATLQGTAGSFTGPVFRPTWVRWLSQDNQVIDSDGDCPASLDLYWTLVPHNT